MLLLVLQLSIVTNLNFVDVSSPSPKKERPDHKDTIDLELHAHPDQSKLSVFQHLKYCVLG